MAFQKFEGGSKKDFSPRPMIKGNWKCSGCNVEITELPFEPAADRPIYCRECWSKKRAEKLEK
ncbi:MAG: hypothetical protein COT67_00150 [Candidatus Tagabacteria bacterium CG09_land_8_20_14_0_10_41_14]|uniref:CxxC-x17-CxxC domain-containing protein n=1 Tax=Candidatus Tagabacteria bacterium CG09_land_8_20_14_0_10_41_14 TaxID=1975021 RepID=A0A2H0WMA4_9BACT|nr:MAG: hypothetical protein COT67_00150 [Candidatus Tagabacteria bacterium CG09_land_8_20_14_0_10_41_14]